MDLFGDYTLRLVALGSAVLGATSGALGSFAYLRRQSLLGDAVSHAALPGIVLAFMLTGSKVPLVLMLGAGLAGWIGTLAVQLVVRRSRVPYDSALGIVLAVFFGIGLVLLTHIQKQSNAAQAGLESFLFGQAASLLRRDVVTMAVLGTAALVILVLLWKEFKLLSFDPDFAASVGLPVRRLDGTLDPLVGGGHCYRFADRRCGPHERHDRRPGSGRPPVESAAGANGSYRGRYRYLFRRRRLALQLAHTAAANRANHRPGSERYRRRIAFSGATPRAAVAFAAARRSACCARSRPRTDAPLCAVPPTSR